MDEVRTRIIYDYGRWDFEQEIYDYAGDNAPIPTDAEWVEIQASLVQQISDTADSIVREHIYTYLAQRKVLGFYTPKEN